MESEGDEDHTDQSNVIIAENDEEYVFLTEANTSINNTSLTKGKYYKQTYRTAWEHMPDFKGWLKGVSGEPTRAYCIYCQKTLHAHRLSLLKHTCTIRHQKAAQMHNTLKMNNQQPLTMAFSEGNSSTHEEEEKDEPDVNSMMHYTTALEDEENDHDIEEEEESEQSEPVKEEFGYFEITKNKSKTLQTNSLAGNSAKQPILTSVTDTSKGGPVSGLLVSLYKLIDGRWTYINEGTTGSEGKCSNFIEQSNFSPGRYKLHFDVDRYFEQKKQESLYPFIEIVFDCKGPGESYHIPLLLSPYGYTTYRSG